ncbi:C-type lectin 37Da-like [Sitophilus oryzae]|uniref:C-type lectin 37Da-like n=1 Tax=Sitophilus oryzae TaxID=7048 RepID=A0A6J2YBW0_SITOR|nr:C-type lectin 37Da-like [Sitophilus oryzae]
MVLKQNCKVLSFLLIILFCCVSCQKYVVVNEPVNWFQALINCKGVGLELASVNSEEETKALQKFLTDNGYKDGYWLAGTRLGNGDYYWATTGTKIIYTDWLRGQPDNAKTEYNKYEGEYCIQLGMPTYSPEPNGWNDLGCNNPMPYICQAVQNCYGSNDVL